MVVFKTKKIISARSIGEDLEKGRKALNLSLKAIEQKCGVGEKYLQAMENNEWDLLPGEIYAKNWLKKYSLFLGFNWEEKKKNFESEISGRVAWSMGDKQLFGVTKKKLLVLPKIFKYIFLAIIITVIVGYLGYQIIDLLSPPELLIIYPADNTILQSRQIKISGQAERGSEVSLNDKEIPIDGNGWFEVDIDLNQGLNVIKLMAKKSYGRAKVEYRRVIVEEEKN